MGNGDNGEKSAVAKFLDYKTLLLGACSLIIILAGALYGVWDRGAQQTAEFNRATNGKQWERITDTEKRIEANGARLEWVEKGLIDHEERLRYLERKVR